MRQSQTHNDLPARDDRSQNLSAVGVNHFADSDCRADDAGARMDDGADVRIVIIRAVNQCGVIEHRIGKIRLLLRAPERCLRRSAHFLDGLSDCMNMVLLLACHCHAEGILQQQLSIAYDRCRNILIPQPQRKRGNLFRNASCFFLFHMV